jgi:hypothetical protein
MMWTNIFSGSSFFLSLKRQRKPSGRRLSRLKAGHPWRIQNRESDESVVLVDGLSGARFLNHKKIQISKFQKN